MGTHISQTMSFLQIKPASIFRRTSCLRFAKSSPGCFTRVYVPPARVAPFGIGAIIPNCHARMSEFRLPKVIRRKAKIADAALLSNTHSDFGIIRVRKPAG